MLKRECFMILKNKRTYIIFMIMIAIVLYDLYSVYQNNVLAQLKAGGAIDLDSVYRPSFAGFLSGNSAGHYTTMLMDYLMPLYLLVIVGDAYITEYKTGCYQILEVRASKRDIFISRLFAAFLTGFLTMFLVLMINYLLALYLFHNGTYDNGLSALTHDMGLLTYGLKNPELTYRIYIFTTSLIYGLCGMMCAAFSFYIKDMKILYGTCSLIWLILMLIPYNLVNCMQPFIEYGWDYILPAIFIYICFILLAILLGYRNKVKCDGL